MGSRAGSIEKSTGVSWEDWTAYLLDRDATKLSHQAIVALVTRRVGELEITTHQATGAPFNTGWWCQGIAIQFEEDHGLRASGQGQGQFVHEEQASPDPSRRQGRFAPG